MQLARGFQPRSKIVLRTCASRNDIIDGIMFAMEELLQARPRGNICKVLRPQMWRFAEKGEHHLPENAEVLVKEACQRKVCPNRKGQVRYASWESPAACILCLLLALESQQQRPEGKRERPANRWEQRRCAINVRRKG